MSYWSQIEWKSEIKSTLLIFIFGSLTIFLWCDDCFQNLAESTFSLIFTGLMWVLLWKGNAHVSDYISHKVSWLENPPKRFVLGIIGVVVYTPIAVYGLSLFAEYIVNVSISDVNDIAISSIGVTFVISFFLNALSFFNNWKKAALDAEKLKKEQMITQYESLKNQVNPHFLFNSLNALTNLVYEDQDRAAAFIRQLSQVYRYVLETRQQELVTLATELEFIEAFVSLQKARFGDKLVVNINPRGQNHKMLPPMAIQMLLENAIKHNEISEQHPLYIQVDVDNEDTLVVENNLRKKNIPLEPSSGLGLENIKARYAFLSDRGVDVQTTNDAFIVKLPLLTMS